MQKPKRTLQKLNMELEEEEKGDDGGEKSEKKKPKKENKIDVYVTELTGELRSGFNLDFHFSYNYNKFKARMSKVTINS